MSYKKVVIMELSDIIRRIRDGQSFSEISRVTGHDRKTTGSISLLSIRRILVKEKPCR